MAFWMQMLMHAMNVESPKGKVLLVVQVRKRELKGVGVVWNCFGSVGIGFVQILCDEEGVRDENPGRCIVDGSVYHSEPSGFNPVCGIPTFLQWGSISRYSSHSVLLHLNRIAWHTYRTFQVLRDQHLSGKVDGISYKRHVLNVS